MIGQITLLGLLLFLVWLSIMLEFYWIHREIKKLKGDIQQVKTAQRASAKRERRLLKQTKV